MHSSPSSRLTTLPVLLAPFLAAALLLAACAGDPPPPGPPGGALTLTLDGTREPRRAPRVVRRLEPPEERLGPDAWDLGPGAEVVRREPRAAGAVLVLPDRSARTITLPGPFDRATFQRVLVHADAETPELVSLRWLRAGRPVGHRPPAPLLPGSGPLRFDLLEEWEGGTVADELELVLQGEGRGIELAAVELLEVPPERYLPAGTEPDWITIGDEARRGVGLCGGERWRASFELRGPSRLLLGLGLPPVARRPGEARLELLLRHGGELRRETIELRRIGADDRPWRTATVALAPEVGEAWRSGRVELEVGVVGSRESVLALEVPRVDRARPGAPVVLLVTSDTHRADHLGAAPGAAAVSTPTLDRLAREGVLFRDALAPANYTVPSHAALLTGHTPRHTGVIDNADSLALEAVTLAERFHEAGFLCLASVSAAHLDPVSSGLGQGFQRFSRPRQSQRDSRQTLARVARWLDELPDRPLFLWVHAFDAHTPYLPPQSFRDRYYPADRDPQAADLPEPPDHAVPSWLPGVRDLDLVRASYAGEVTYLDRQLGRLLEHPALARAVVAVTADHGESLGEQDVWFSHEALSVPTLAVPLVLRAPVLPASLRGQVLERPVVNIDLGRTLLDLAGLERADFPGRNLLERSPEGDLPRFALGPRGRSAAVEFLGWYLVLHLAEHELESGQHLERHQVQLFDRRADPRCERDLAAAERERAGKLRALLVRQLTRTDRPAWESEVPAGAAHLAHVRALGYAEGRDDRAEEGWIDPDCACVHCRAFEGPAGAGSW